MNNDSDLFSIVASLLFSTFFSFPVPPHSSSPASFNALISHSFNPQMKGKGGGNTNRTYNNKSYIYKALHVG